MIEMSEDDVLSGKVVLAIGDRTYDVPVCTIAESKSAFVFFFTRTMGLAHPV